MSSLARTDGARKDIDHGEIVPLRALPVVPLTLRRRRIAHSATAVSYRLPTADRRRWRRVKQVEAPGVESRRAMPVSIRFDRFAELWTPNSGH